MLLLVSEERDHGSKHTKADQLVEKIGRSDVLVLSISFSPAKAELLHDAKDSGEERIMSPISTLLMIVQAFKKNAAKEIAHMSGGEYHAFTGEKGFEQRVVDAAKHSHNRYLITFSPSNPTPGLHTIRSYGAGLWCPDCRKGQLLAGAGALAYANPERQREGMTKARLDGLTILLLGSVMFILFGYVLAINAPCDMVDFRVQYSPARCLLQQCDPYSESEVLRIAQAEGGIRPWDAARGSHFARYVYFPTAFSFTVPIALLPWEYARILWMVFTFSSLIFAAFLMWTSRRLRRRLSPDCLRAFFSLVVNYFSSRVMWRGSRSHFAYRRLVLCSAAIRSSWHFLSCGSSAR